MIIDCVITATNDNPKYVNFIPLFIKMWKYLIPNIDVKIIFVSTYIPKKFKEFEKNIILFKPRDDIPTKFISQYVRILYPAIMNYKNGVIISDMDMLPMNGKYYVDTIKNYSDDKFISYRQYSCAFKNNLAICYNVATPQIWKQINKINNLEDIYTRLKKVSKIMCWTRDQLDLFKLMITWNKKTKNHIVFNDEDTGFDRLDRIRFETLTPQMEQKIIEHKFVDYHCKRPYLKFKQLNDRIFELLQKK
jgi:hypothetical protein